MYLTDEDKTQYNLIEDVNNSRIIGRVEDIINYLSDEIQYNLNNTDDEETIEQLKEINRQLATEDFNMVIAIYENAMIGIDWQEIE